MAIILNEGRIPHSLPVFTFVQGRIELLSKYPLYALSPIKIIVPPQYVGMYVGMYVCVYCQRVADLERMWHLLGCAYE